MPNWCFNRVTVRGDNERVAKVVAAVRGRYGDGEECPLDFRRILPPPPDVGSGEVTWCYEHWGTKWLPQYPHVENAGADGEFVVSFQSANTPPQDFVRVLSERFPDVRVELYYDQPDFGYGAELAYMDGALVAEDYWEDEEDELADG